MIINHNIAALNTHRQLGMNNTAASGNLEKLSSGLKINKAGDDAAGLAISEKMRGQIRGLDMASKNAQDGISLIQTAEGALNETHSILQRMRELAVQSSNDTNTDSDRAELQKEVDQLAQEISRISNDTEFNTQNLAGGNFTGTFHIGSNAGQSISLSIGAMDAFSLGVARDVDVIKAEGDGTTVTNAKVAEGSELTAGTVNVAAQADTGTAATTTINGIDFEADVAGVNNAEIEIVQSADSGASSTGVVVDSGTGKITITIGTDSGGSSLVTDNDSLVAAINGVSGITVTAALADGTDGSDTATVAGTETLSGGIDADPDKVQVTLSAGGETQVLTVDKTATSISVTAGDFKGLSFDVAGLDEADLTGFAGTVTLTSETATATAANVDADGKMVKAEAKGGIDISSQTTADSAITTIQTAIDTVSAERSKLGAMQNRLEHTINNLGTSSENLTAAESRIRDVDMAAEMMEFTKNNILTQAAQAMLAQAQQTPQGVLQLLR